MTICVSIGCADADELNKRHRELAAIGVELVELRLDYLTELPDPAKLLANRPTPVIVTCRRQIDKGHWRHSEQQRQAVLQAAMTAGAEYVDLEDDIAASIRRNGASQRIISRHDFDTTPAELESLHAQMQHGDPDIVKLVTMANSLCDSVRMLQLVDSAAVPTVGFCMGEFGTLSRVLCGRYGSPFTYAAAESGREVAPGQLSFQQMSQLYRYDKLTLSTQIFGVLGDPIAHSMSPLIHNTAMAFCGYDGVYLPLRVRPDEFEQVLNALDWLGLAGYSVTIPHKQVALNRARQHDEATSSIRAANTLYVTDGEWRAANTDYQAIVECLELGLPSQSKLPAAKSLAGKHVLMLGAGGVARAAGLAVTRLGAKLTIANRTRSRAAELAQHWQAETVDWDKRETIQADIVINCTAVGMHPRVDESPLPATALHSEMLVFDTVYNPEQTRLLQQAEEMGCATVGGLEMFVRQAAAQFELFSQQPAPFELMRDTVRTALRS